MKTSSNLNGLRSALRVQLCVECEQQSAASPAAPPAPAVAPCEGDCPLFVNLPRLARVAKEGVPPCGYDVYSKSLDPARGKTQVPDIAEALRIIEVAECASSHLGHGQVQS